MEARWFITRCDGQVSLLERADTLSEISRLATSVTLPTMIAEDYSARDALRLLQSCAEERARELIQEHLKDFVHADENQREKRRRAMFDAWSAFTGPLGHLRTRAQNKLTVAEQQNT